MAAAATQATAQAIQFKLNEGIYATRILAAQSLTTRHPTHLCVLLDTSGSMEIEDRLTNVVKSLSFLLDYMSSTDYISVITFNTNAKTHILQKQITAENKEIIRQEFAHLKAEGNTNISAAILEGFSTFMKQPHIKESILFLTDGEANVGLIKPEELISLVKYGLAMNSSLSYAAVGYGETHNSELLRSLAAEGGGSYNVVSNLEDTATVFGDILGGLQTCVAQNVKVEYSSTAEVQTSYATSIRDATLQVYIGDLQAEADIYILSNQPAQKISWNNLPTGELVQVESTMQTEPTDAERKAATIAAIRYKVVQLMNAIRANYVEVDLRPAYKHQIAQLQLQMDAIADSEIITILKKQLNDCKNMLEAPVDHTGHTTVLLSQHSACIGMGRGFISGTESSPFANRTQRHISSGMRTQAVSSDPQAFSED